MNKKLLFGLFAACTMLFAVSCTEEADVTNSDKVQFTLKKPAAAAGQSLGNEDDPYILVAQVFDHKGDLLQKLSKTITPAFADDLKEEVSLELVRNQDYTVVFWTQRSKSQSFDYRDLTDIQINYDEFVKEAQNSNSVDAFFGSTSVSGGIVTHDVYLTRPFAQVNVVIPATEYEWATVNAEAHLNSTHITVNKLATGFNAITGAITGTKENITFSAAALPTETLEIDTAGTGVTTTYRLLSTNLLLANDLSNEGNASTLAKITCTITTGNQPIEILSENTPIQRNYRTNIILQSLKRTHEFTVEVKPEVLGEFNINADVEKTYTEAIQDMIAAGGTVTVDSALTKIDLTGVTNDLTLYLNAKVGSVIMGTATSTAAAPAAVYAAPAATVAPNITINVAKDVAYPTFTFTGAVQNYTIKGDPTTSEALTTNFINDNNTSITNLTLDGIKIVEGVAFVFDHQEKYIKAGSLMSGKNITVKNCVGTGLKKTFLRMTSCIDAQILNNNISYATMDGITHHGIDLYVPYATLVEGNTITNADKHGLMINWANNNVITVKNNIFNGAGEDGVKADSSRYVVVTNNTINVSEYGVRIDRLHSDEAGHTTTLTISNNTISTPANNGAYAICVNNRDDKDHPKATGTINLTAKDNKIGDGGIGGNRYFIVKDNGMTLTGDCQTPFTVADGVAIAADGTYAISNKEGMYWFADQVNNVGKSFYGETLVLTQDIDLENTYWESIGQTGSSKTLFQGTFDGKNYTIRNLKIGNENEEGSYHSSGLFGWVEQAYATFKNIKVDGAWVKGHHYVAVIVGYNYGTVENCHVSNATIYCTHAGTEPCGDKAGTIVGYNQGTISNCTATNCQITAGRDAGTIVGYSHPDNVINCSATEVTISEDPTCPRKGENMAGGIIGRTN